MPQMKPLSWLFLYFVFSIVILIYVIVIFFSSLNTCKVMNNNSAKMKSTCWKW